MISAMVLSAGLGNRLRPLTEWCAKPLVPVGDRPALAHILDHLARAGVTVVVANAHHRVDDLRAFAASRGILLSEERELLGTAGGVAHASTSLGAGDVLVWNGDILADVDVAGLVSAHVAAQARQVVATLVVQRGAAGSGNVGIDAAGQIVRLRQETVAKGEILGGAFVGVHVVGEALRGSLPFRGCLVGDVYLPALRGGARMTAYDHAGDFRDIGTLPAYLEANLSWLRARGLGAWTSPTAKIAPGISLTRSVVGAHAVLDGEGLLLESVVWPDAHARAPLARAIVTPRGTVTL